MDDKRKNGDIAFSVPWKKLLFFPGHAANSEDGTKRNGARVPCMRRSIGKRLNSLCWRWNGGQSSKVKNDYAGLSTLFAKKALWRVHLRWNDVRIWSKLELSRDWLEGNGIFFFPANLRPVSLPKGRIKFTNDIQIALGFNILNGWWKAKRWAAGIILNEIALEYQDRKNRSSEWVYVKL